MSAAKAAPSVTPAQRTPSSGTVSLSTSSSAGTSNSSTTPAAARASSPAPTTPPSSTSAPSTTACSGTTLTAAPGFLPTVPIQSWLSAGNTAAAAANGLASWTDLHALLFSEWHRNLGLSSDGNPFHQQHDAAATLMRLQQHPSTTQPNSRLAPGSHDHIPSNTMYNVASLPNPLLGPSVNTKPADMLGSSIPSILPMPPMALGNAPAFGQDQPLATGIMPADGVMGGNMPWGPFHQPLPPCISPASTTTGPMQYGSETMLAQPSGLGLAASSNDDISSNVAFAGLDNGATGDDGRDASSGSGTAGPSPAQGSPKKTSRQSRANSKSNTCPQCGKSYARQSTLKTHMRTHTGERPYQCTTCDKSFSQAANLNAHLRTHTGDKPFACTICQRRFSQSSSVTTHMRTHSGERPYHCQLCNKSFADTSTLTKHIRTHTGRKPYACRVCGTSFSQSGNLNRHMRTHGTAARPSDV